ncbi:MAG: LysM peptidoglycan-binding domain-containing protein [Duncaniella sp.]|uniref:lytic transglycosylase n=1 Tax=Duncaniella sp. TaxID=2518496 RepID=UPI0023CF8F0A|nr:LysM peptidoglycan-binding domain-containing protein [Duncaniella sp.]MDE5988748.1 LysM peptidoglycan-binding domain-containing protein [Duncaniella sp.]
MKFRRLTISALTAIAVATGLSADAAVKDLPVKVINGHSYHYYTVESKETIYSLCHKFGISKDELVKFNPSVADGLKAGTMLFFPVEENEILTPDNAGRHGVSLVSHTVAKGETIYGIAKRYGLTTDVLIEQNPIVREGLKAGQTLHLTVPVKACDEQSASTGCGVTVASQSQGTENRVAPSGYIVKKKETFYSIANAHGITVEQLEAANPGITVLKEGQVLSIPASQSALADASQPASPSIPVGADGTVSVDDFARASGVDPNAKEELSVALVLPFMLNEETPSKSAQRYTEFYKGFLIAVDSLRNNGVPVRVTAYDSEGSTSKVRHLTSDSTLRTHRMIIAPDAADQLAILGDFGREHGIKVFNGFIVRDESYQTNPAVMQGTIPSQQMIDKAAEAIAGRLSYSTPVFVSLADGANADKADFITALKRRLESKGVKWLTVSADSKLAASDLKTLKTDGNYTFIPLSARQSDLNRIMPAIIEWRDETGLPGVKMVGYPEWITFRGETLQNMHKLNTTVYSRFFVDDDNIRTRRLEDRFKGWYGAGMENAVPRQGLLGFDTGMFVLDYLKNPVARYDGVQNGYSFLTPEGAEGQCNNVLYLINFRSGGQIEKINL